MQLQLPTSLLSVIALSLWTVVLILGFGAAMGSPGYSLFRGASQMSERAGWMLCGLTLAAVVVTSYFLLGALAMIVAVIGSASLFLELTSSSWNYLKGVWRGTVTKENAARGIADSVVRLFKDESRAGTVCVASLILGPVLFAASLETLGWLPNWANFRAPYRLWPYEPLVSAEQGVVIWIACLAAFVISIVFARRHESRLDSFPLSRGGTILFFVPRVLGFIFPILFAGYCFGVPAKGFLAIACLFGIVGAVLSFIRYTRLENEWGRRCC